MKGGAGGTQTRAKRRMSWRNVLSVACALIALTLVLYAPAARWWNDYLHAQAIKDVNATVAEGPQSRFDAIRADAQAYNARLMASGDTDGYADQLNPYGDGLMGRIKIPTIGVDLPIYHTSSDAVLRKGAGHMEETTLPVGGLGTHAAITAHRGLAQSTLFTNLDKVGMGDTFTLEILGEPLVYRVETVRIVEPTETQWLVPDPTKDQVTLITCDPLGINTERMLVSGTRITPTPPQAYEELGAPSRLPGFPWFAVLGAGGLLVVTIMARTSRTPRTNKTADNAATISDNEAVGPRP